MTNPSVNSMPAQKLPMSKKGKAWREACVNYVIGHSGFSGGFGNNGRARYDEMQNLYNLYNSIYSQKDLMYVTNPFKQKDGFPATALDYNIIKPKIDLLLGEETKRPFNFTVIRTSNDAASAVQDLAKQMLDQYVMATIMSKLGPGEQARYQQALANGEIMPPDQIQKYIERDYKDVAELTAQSVLNYLEQKLNIKHEFYKGWKDALVAGEEIYYTGVINGDPVLERINPMFFAYDLNSDIEFIHDSDWCCRKMIMSVSEIYDRFYDKMDNKQLNELLEMMNGDGRFGMNPEFAKSELDYAHQDVKWFKGPNDNFYEGDNIEVWHACWKSFKKIGFITYVDPTTGVIDEIQVDESYKITGTEINVEWDWIIETWEGYRIGKDMYVGVQPIEYQYRSADNPNAQKLPYTGAVYNNTNTKPKSLVSMMKPLQYMYIILWYRLELALARDGGKVMYVDVTQIPKSMGIDVNKWMHYIKALGVAFVNPYEEGWDIPGREGGKPAQFNQWSAVDLSLAQVIDQYINLMYKIEEMVSELSGVTRQRQGAISSSELVGNVERSVIQSAHITEPWFWQHQQVKKQVLTMLLDTAKAAWVDTKTNLQYILDDARRAFMTLSDDFFFSDMDVFVDDSTKNQQQIEMLKSLAQPAMQNGATLLDIAEVITMDNVNQIKDKLQEIEAKRMEQTQAMQEQQFQQQQALQQMQSDIAAQEIAQKQAELEFDYYKVDADNLTRLVAAQINAYRGNEDLDQDANGVPDVIEIGKLGLQQLKQFSDERLKQAEITAKERDAQLRKLIEDKRAQLEEKRMANELKLLKMKDDAAMERERLKAKTAKQNKVVGEK